MNWRRGIAWARGGDPSQAVGYTPEEVRRARRQVRRGEAAADERDAALANLVARQEDTSAGGSAGLLFFGVLALAMAALAVDAWSDGDALAGTVFIVGFLIFVAIVATDRRRASGVERSAQANRERYGDLPEPALTPVSVSGPEKAVGIALSVMLVGGAFGVSLEAVDEGPFEVLDAFVRGLFFGVAMTAYYTLTNRGSPARP